jgi:Ca2+-transporting ATPase
MGPTPRWHARSAVDVAAALQVAIGSGLANDEVARRQARDGPNALPDKPPLPILFVFARQFASPLIALLLLAAAIAVAVGELVDAAVIAVVVVLNALVGAVQEGRAERSLAALKKLAGRTTRVMREGAERTIASADVVVGDVLVLGAGDAVAADARLVHAANLLVAEAALTGESVPVVKTPTAVEDDTPLADRSSMVFSGTFVVAGRAAAVVTATGPQTEIGAIAALASSTKEPPTPLERRIARLGRAVLAMAAVLFVVVLVVGLARGVPTQELLMVAISQFVGLVPEGLPVAMTVALSVGVQRMARRRAVVRRLAAVETLGSTTVICTDKTGTLTRNEMTATTVVLADGRRIDISGSGYAPTGALHLAGRTIAASDDNAVAEFIRAAVLCNDAALEVPAEPFRPWCPVGDPTEVALVTLAWKAGVVPDELRRRYRRRAELPFDSDARLMATQHDAGDGGDVIFLKGAPESVLPLCLRFRQGGAEAPLGDQERRRFQSDAEELARAALRVLAVAILPDRRLDPGAGFPGLTGATLLGFVGEIDPPRDEVKDAVALCRSAGIRPVMITGDHKTTGWAIATMVGIARGEDEAIDGKELESLDDDALRRRLSTTAVFARIQPAQKLRIVESLQASHEVVAMTGDGVNDAPALVRADVGVAMGRSGTEVAKEAAKVVLLDDNFATLVAAVEEGRVVYRNIKKALLLLLSTSLAEVLILLGALVLGHPPPFHAVQILWNNLVTEGVITVNLIMDPPKGDEMKRPPTPPTEPLVDRVLVQRMLVMVPTIVTLTLGWFMVRTAVGVDARQVQTETFTLLALCEWFNVLNCRSAVRSALSMRIVANPWLLGGLVVGNALQALVVFAPPLQQVFRTTALGGAEVVALGVVASTVLWVEELRKLLVRRRDRRA